MGAFFLSFFFFFWGGGGGVGFSNTLVEISKGLIISTPCKVAVWVEGRGSQQFRDALRALDSSKGSGFRV